MTEPEYFSGLNRSEHCSGSHFKPDGFHSSPLKMVERAARLLRTKGSKPDAVWVVCDGDEHADLDRAIALAAKSGVEMAISNPCFELWLLLHFQDHTARISVSDCSRLLKNHLPRYDKHVDFAGDFAGRLDAAVARAAQLDRNCSADPRTELANPMTGVFRLVSN